MEIRKEPRFLEVICKPIIYKFFKNFTNHRENANRVVVFGSRPLPNILKYKDNRWDLPGFSIYESSGSQFLRTTTGI